MLNVARLAVDMTTTGRKMVKRVATKKINLSKASQEFKDMYTYSKRNNDYCKNIFKRVFAWVKDFVSNMKNIINETKSYIEEKVNATPIGETFTNKTLKAWKKESLNNAKNNLVAIKDEMIKLTKKTTKKSKPGIKK